MRTCVFAGTFDPFTVGHEDTVKKCLALFDEVVVAVAENKRKQCLFSLAEREAMIKKVFAAEPRVRVISWDGVIVDLLKKEKTNIYVRGVRNAVDFEYENDDFFASRDLSPDMVTVYIPAEQKFVHVSSTLVKNCIAFGKPYKAYVPEAVYDYIQTREETHVPQAD